MRRSHRSKPVTPALLRGWSLPLPRNGDKNDRGCVLVAGGCAQMPGAVILSAESALRAGAGKLQIATVASIAAAVGATVPEALVVGLPQTRSGAIARAGSAAIVDLAERSDALVLGPGMTDESGCAQITAGVVREVSCALVLDALAVTSLGRKEFAPFQVPAVLTPHAGEMASLVHASKEEVESNPQAYAVDAARSFGAVVVLKGAQTYIATPQGQLYCNRAGTVGLATSGSGDTLAGAIGGFLARGLSPVRAACWGVYVHARAGEALMRKTGLGFLARELPSEIPRIVRALS